MPPRSGSGRLGLRAGAARRTARVTGGGIDVQAQRTSLAELRAQLGRRFEPILHEQVQVVALVDELDTHLGVELLEPACLAVLLRDELLVERRDLDVQVVRGEIEVRGESLRRAPVTVTLERERTRLVLPLDAVEVEELRELALGVVGEAHTLVRQRRFARGHVRSAALGCGGPAG